MEERILDINEEAKVETFEEFFMSDTKDILDDSIDYVVDAIDTVTSKIELIERAKKLNIPIISSMGTGNKLDPSRFEITDISKTLVCPLAKIIRKELRNRNIEDVKVVYSKEEAIVPLKDGQRVQVMGSISFVPPTAGLLIASEVIKDLIKGDKK